MYVCGGLGGQYHGAKVHISFIRFSFVYVFLLYFCII